MKTWFLFLISLTFSSTSFSNSSIQYYSGFNKSLGDHIGVFFWQSQGEFQGIVLSCNKPYTTLKSKSPDNDFKTDKYYLIIIEKFTFPSGADNPTQLFVQTFNEKAKFTKITPNAIEVGQSLFETPSGLLVRKANPELGSIIMSLFNYGTVAKVPNNRIGISGSSILSGFQEMADFIRFFNKLF